MFWWKITQKTQITFLPGVCIWKAQSCSNFLLKRVARTQIPPSASLCRWHLDFLCVKCPWVKSPTVIWLLCIDRFCPCRGTFFCAEKESAAGGFLKREKQRTKKAHELKFLLQARLLSLTGSSFSLGSCCHVRFYGCCQVLGGSFCTLKWARAYTGDVPWILLC